MSASAQAANMIKLDDLKIIAQYFHSFERYVRMITGDNETDFHEMLVEIIGKSEEQGIVDKGFFIKDIDSKVLGIAVVKALREIIDQHGPLQKLFIGAATKRIVNNILLLKGK